MGTLSNMVYYAAFKQERGGSYRENVFLLNTYYNNNAFQSMFFISLPLSQLVVEMLIF